MGAAIQTQIIEVVIKASEIEHASRMRSENEQRRIKPKFQPDIMGMSIVINDLCQFPVPVSGHILIIRSASASRASASVTCRKVFCLGSRVTTHVLVQHVLG